MYTLKIKCVQNVFSNRSRWEAYNAALKGGVAPPGGKGRKKGGERPEDGIGDQDPPSFKTDRRLCYHLLRGYNVRCKASL